MSSLAAPKISIVVPIYNVEKYLDRCINSLLSQTLTDIEIILVDDGSPDNCPSMCDRWAERDSRIKVVHKANAGLGFARNSGIDVAIGDYVGFCDSDDAVEDTMYQNLYEATENGKYDVVYSGFRYETPQGQWRESRSFPDIRTFDRTDADKVALSFVAETDITTGNRLVMSCCTVIYRRELLNRYNIRQMSEREVLSEDMIFQIQVAQHASRVKFIPNCQYHYYVNGASLTHTFKDSKFDAACRIREIMSEILPHDSYNRMRVDYDFYSRIRSLVFQMICQSDHSLKQCYNVLKPLCRKISALSLDTTLIRCKTWKYRYYLRLLQARMPAAIILFAYFDRYINKNTLFFWKRR